MRGQISSKLKKAIKVETIDISELLKDIQFDKFKFEEEDVEEFVVPRCERLLHSVQHFFIKYYSDLKSFV